MTRRTSTIKYCDQCPGWRGFEVVCHVCKRNTVDKEIPARRGGMYFVDASDKPLPSVTTILGILAKPGLDHWKLQKVAEAALADPGIDIKEAINAPNKVRDAAASKGSDIHKIIDHHFKKEPVEIDNYDEPWRSYIEAYFNYVRFMPHTILKAEQVVYSIKHGFAGQCDAIIQAGDTVFLIDYKTSKAVDRKGYGMQLSGYKLALEEMGTHIDKLAVLQLKPDKTFEFVEVPYTPDEFLAALRLYTFINS